MILPNSSLDQTDIVALETVPIGKTFFWILLAKSLLNHKSPGSPCTTFFSGTHPPNMCMSLCRSPFQYRLPWWLGGKEYSCWCRRHGFDPWVRPILQRRKWQPVSALLPRKAHGQRSLGHYSLWGHKSVGQELRTKHQSYQYFKCKPIVDITECSFIMAKEPL